MVVATKYMPNAPALQQHFPEPMFVDGDSESDEKSTTSTVLNSSAGELVKDDSQLRLQTCSRDKKPGVRFATQVSYACDQEQHANSDDLWYTAAEYHVFRKSTLSQAQHVIDTEKRIRTPHSYHRVLHRIYVRHCCYTDPIPAQESIRLQNWMTAAPSRVGLERWCIRVIANDKTLRRKAVVAGVKTAQSTSGGDNDVRLASEQYSRASVLMAQAMAKGVAGSLGRAESHPRY